MRDRTTLTALLCLALGCATTSTPESPSGDVAARTAEPPRLSQAGERYLEAVFVYGCAWDYLPYPEGTGPPVPERTEAAWRERREALERCRQGVLDEYTKLEKIRMMTRSGDDHALSEAEMLGVVRFGDVYLREYVDDLLAGERRRAATGSGRPLHFGVR